MTQDPPDFSHIPDLPALQGLLDSGSLRAVLESKELAQLGDFLVNFVYTTVKIGIKGGSGSVHVWDSSLRDAMEYSNLREKLGRRTKPGRVADAAESFIAFAYFHGVMSLNGMVEYLSRRLNLEDFDIPKIEKAACATAFGELLSRLSYLVNNTDLLDFDG